MNEGDEFDDSSRRGRVKRAKTEKIDTDASSRELSELTRLGQRFSRTMTSAFEAVAVKGRSLREVFRSVATSMSQMVLKAAMKPLRNALGGALESLVGGALSFAKGGFAPSRMPTPFAKGGVIASPIGFPLTGGKIGIAGEAGPEAIMPFARGADERLGVASASGGGVQVTFNVTSPDAASFARSESQIAAMLARTVGQGQRNL